MQRLFADKYLNDDDKLDPRKYEIIFRYDFLENRKMQVQELELLVRFMKEKRK